MNRYKVHREVICNILSAFEIKIACVGIIHFHYKHQSQCKIEMLIVISFAFITLVFMFYTVIGPIHIFKKLEWHKFEHKY